MDNSEIIVRLGEMIREQKKTNELLEQIVKESREVVAAVDRLRKTVEI